jgi:hypothetical protein
MNFPEYKTKTDLKNIHLKVDETEDFFRTKNGLFEIHLISRPKNQIEKPKKYVVLVTLQDMSWIANECKTAFFTFEDDPQNSKWARIIEVQ